MLKKILNRFWKILIKKTRNSKVYPFFYRSYWNLLFQGEKENTNNSDLYFTAIPNKGAGIGHQIANWISGYWFAHQFYLNYAYASFSSKKWDNFLGFDKNEISLNELLNSRKYKKVKLPLFNEENSHELALIKKIISSYGNKKVVFVCEQDQFYKDQFGVINEIQEKFHNHEKRKNDHLIYDKSNFNIAVHVRRGDITIGQENKNPNLTMRWQTNDYFTKVLSQVLEKIQTNKPIKIYLFSQGTKEDFVDFNQFQNIHYCLDMDALNSFLHLVMADLLITSKSSFSYKPALLNRGIKVVPADFWHGYPKSKDWILVDSYGNFKIDLNENNK